MESEVVLPDSIAVMTLPEIAFFPQALLPLHIFEPRYRRMLRDVLAADRLLAVAGLQSNSPGFEPPYPIAGIGVIRACQKNDNGTSNLLLQGLSRIEILEILTDEPYRKIRIRPLASTPGATGDENVKLRAHVAKLLSLKSKLAASASNELTHFLDTIQDPEMYIDIAAFNLCEVPSVKQKLLETLDVHRRLEIFSGQLQGEIDAIKLRRKLQGNLPDDRIVSN